MSEIVKTVCDACGRERRGSEKGWSYFGRTKPDFGPFDFCPACSKVVCGCIKGLRDGRA